MLAVASIALLALPAAADVWTVQLTNGTTFESRYQPRQAAWDPSVMTFVDETGLEVALPRTLVASVRSLNETRGYGRVLDTATIDMGFAPNDVPEAQRAMLAAAQAAGTNVVYHQQQFIEPSDLSGLPVGYATGTGIGQFPANTAAAAAAAAAAGATGTPSPFTEPQMSGGTPVPFTPAATPATGTPAPFTGAPAGTPVPFTPGATPSTGTPAPFTTTSPATTTSSPGGTGASGGSGGPGAG